MSAAGKRVAARKRALTGELVSRAEPGAAPYVIWDDRLTGFGLRVSPGGAKAFFVQYRTGEGRRTDRNRKLTLGRYPGLSPGSARKRAQALLGRARDGRDPAGERALSRGMPSVSEAVEAWLATRQVKEASLALYRRSAGVWLKGWQGRRNGGRRRARPGPAPMSTRDHTRYVHRATAGQSTFASSSRSRRVCRHGRLGVIARGVRPATGSSRPESTARPARFEGTRAPCRAVYAPPTHDGNVAAHLARSLACEIALGEQGFATVLEWCTGCRSRPSDNLPGQRIKHQTKAFLRPLRHARLRHLVASARRDRTRRRGEGSVPDASPPPRAMGERIPLTVRPEGMALVEATVSSCFFQLFGARGRRGVSWPGAGRGSVRIRRLVEPQVCGSRHDRE